MRKIFHLKNTKLSTVGEEHVKEKHAKLRRPQKKPGKKERNSENSHNRSSFSGEKPVFVVKSKFPHE